MNPLNLQALNAVTASANSNPIQTQQVVSISAQAIATGTIAGAVKFQFSNDPTLGSGPTNWSDISGATVTLIGTAGVFAIPFTQITYNWIRVVFIASGGTGTVTVNYQSIGY